MRLVVTRLRSLVRDDSGQDLLEYALLIALIALACVVAVTTAGSAVAAVFTTTAGKMPTAYHPLFDHDTHSQRGAGWSRPTFAPGEGQMQRLLIVVSRLVRADDAQDLIEYSLLAMLIAIGAIVAVTSTGNALNSILWQTIASNASF